ncbi:hypothetical protein HanIR_Chr14g0710781 [Helianthus annuus]|nr:hypothetical protein HanIR_Chr14g0710781 [Helianthus annuus]
MASFLQRLVRRQSLTKTLITDLNKRILSSPTHLSDPKPDPTIPFFNNLPITTDSPTVYPSFSFGAFLNPISYQSVVPEEEEDIVDEAGIWADSVKKKRKKKMNKHKLKKLRKRLRRKT